MGTLKKFNKQLDSIAECIARDQNRIEVAALNEGFALMMLRIFGQGAAGGGAAIDGIPFGKYTKNYLSLRRRITGQNNLSKNLMFTKSLRQTIQHGTNNGKNVIGFENDDLAKIARFQETSDVQINKPIFGFTTQETKVTQQVLIEEIQDTIKRCLKKK